MPLIGIREVARLADVSTATVSRVLNNSSHVDASKKARVLKVIEETGFKPNEIARSFTIKSSRIIGLILPNIMNPFFSEVGRAVEDRARRNNYQLILCNSDEDPEKQQEYYDTLKSIHADGIIIISNNTNLSALFKGSKIPVVIIDNSIFHPNVVASLYSNNYEGGRLATNHLIECGCKHIVSLSGKIEFPASWFRWKGYTDVCVEQGLEPRYVESLFNFEDGYTNAQKLLDQYPDVDGIVAACDILAISLIRVLTERGKRIPQDVMVIGYDNISMDRVITPALTTIAQPIAQLGHYAVDILIETIKSGWKDDPKSTNSYERREVVLPVELIIRDTTCLIKS